MTETDTTPRVLFLCTHNAARSQMAEAFLHHYAGDRFEVLQCGPRTDPGASADPPGPDRNRPGPSGLRAKGLNDFLGRVRIHYAIIVCDQVEEALSAPLSLRAPDPLLAV